MNGFAGSLPHRIVHITRHEAMVRIIQPCIGDVWEFHEGGFYTVVGFVRHFGCDREYVVCEGDGGQRIWPKDEWMHLVPYHGADALSGAMVRPFTLVRQGLLPRTDSLFGRPTSVSPDGLR